MVGLTVSTCPSAGWCATGGPWIKPEDGMQVLVWSATRVKGPARFTGQLPQPQVIEGHYRDVAVLAVPDKSEPLVSLGEISAVGTKDEPRQLVDGNPGTAVRFRGGAQDPRPRVELQLLRPTMVRGLSLEFADVPRCQHLLRQGVPVVDIACFLGEAVASEANVMGNVKELHRLPVGIDYDLCNAEILLTRMSAKDGRIVLPDGMSYALLYVPTSVASVRPEVLAKIRDLVRGGATLVGNPPTASPSLENHPACDREVETLAAELWGTDGNQTVTGRRVGSGRVYPAASLDQALAALGLVEDFSFTAAQPGALIESYHRRSAQADIYFVANRLGRDVEAVCTFRVNGKVPELWYPDTGRIAASTNWTRENERTSVAITLEPQGAVFVVFRRAGDPPAVRTMLRESPVAEINGAWAVAFQKDRGAPGHADFPALIPWNEHPEPGIEYFSGTATYRTKFTWRGGTLGARGSLFLDLGEVREIAEVTLNGKNLGILWKKPFRADITGVAKAGENDLAIEVVNLWVNRMIGDEVMYLDDAAYAPLAAGDWKGFQLRGGLPDWFDAWSRGQGSRPTGRVAFATVKFFSAKDPLRPSGLIGPVRIIGTEEQRVRASP